MVKEKTDDDITLDFSWLKNILPKKTDTQESTDEDVTLDLSKTSGFLKKYAVFFLLLIPIFYRFILEHCQQICQWQMTGQGKAFILI